MIISRVVMRKQVQREPERGRMTREVFWPGRGETESQTRVM